MTCGREASGPRPGKPPRRVRGRGFLRNALRGLRLRLLVPLFRGKHPPEHIARGVAVGLAAALTPLVGVQIPLVVAWWLIVRRVAPAWDFHLGVAMAWTFLTNVLTLPFFYYAFLVTGRVMLGRWDRIRDFDTFSNRLGGVTTKDSGWLESVGDYLVGMFAEFGWPMFVGSAPWAILGAWIGYRWSLHLVTTFRRNRARR